MKKALFSFVFLCATLSSAWGQTEAIKHLFINIPDDLMPSISESYRRDLLDFYESKMTPKIHNGWGEASEILRIEENSLLLREDSEGSILTQLSILTDAKHCDSTLCLIRTFSLPQKDSEILFFTSSWKELKTEKILQLLSVEELLAKEQGVAFDACSLRIEYDDKGAVLVQEFDISDGEKDKQTPSIPPIRYRFDGKKFIIQTKLNKK